MPLPAEFHRQAKLGEPDVENVEVHNNALATILEQANSWLLTCLIRFGAALGPLLPMGVIRCMCHAQRVRSKRFEPSCNTK